MFTNFFLNKIKFEKTLLICISNFKSMKLFTIFNSNIITFINCLKQCFFYEFYPFAAINVYDEEVQKEFFVIKLRDFFY